MNNVTLYAASVLIWGSTWLAISFQLGTVPPEISVVYRYALASVLLFGWCLMRGRSLRFPPLAHVRFLMLGLLLFSFNYIATYSAQQYISSALNAVAFSTMMWMNILNARIFLGRRITGRVYAGALLGITGIVTLFWPEMENLQLGDRVLRGAALCLGGAFLASLGNIVSQDAQARGLPLVQSNAWGMAYGTVLTALVALRGDLPWVMDFSPDYLLSLLYLSVFGSILAFGAYLKLVGRIGAEKAGYAVVLFPVVALVLSVWFEQLPVTPLMLAGVALVLAGNLIILGPHHLPARLRQLALLAGVMVSTRRATGGKVIAADALGPGPEDCHRM